MTRGDKPIIYANLLSYFWTAAKEGIQSKDAVTIDAAFQKEQLARLKDVRQQLIDGRLWSV